MDGALTFLTREDLRILQPKMRLARAGAGQQLVKEGRLPIGLFIVREGEAEIRRQVGDTSLVVAELGKNDIFGEAAFLQKFPASASVQARTEVDLVILTPDRLAPLFEEHPGLFARFFQSLALTISRRLRAFNEQVGGKRQDRFGDLPNWEIL